MGIVKLFSSLLDRVFVVAGAFIGSQVPAFMQQYTNRLAGHVEELKHLVEAIQKSASLSGKTLDQYIHKFLTNSDQDFVQQGEFMQSLVNRWDSFSTALRHLSESTVWSRPFVFIRELHYDVAGSTLYSFQPNIVLTIEGLCYTGLGILTGYSTYYLLTKIFRFDKPHTAVLPDC